jgi:mono/diheme cytochrome c family protein
MEQQYLRLFQRLTIAGSLLCIVFFGFAAVEEQLLQDWKIHQQAYKNILITQSDTPEKMERAQNYSIEIRQILLDDFNAVDRCISCHAGIDNPQTTKQPQPHRAHSGNYLKHHPVDKFGCTVCHGGPGRALSTSQPFMQNLDFHEEYPLTPMKYVQYSCGRCHGSLFRSSEQLEGAERLFQGRNIFLREGCLACHNVRGTGGATGLELTNNGAKTTHEYSFAQVHGEHSKISWLREHFVNPQTVSPGSVMPQVLLPAHEMDVLITYTMSLYEPEYPIDYYGFSYVEEVKGHRADLPAERAFDLLCSKCHGENGEGNEFREFERFVPALNNREFLATASDDMLAFTIEHGRGGMYMSPWMEGKGGLRKTEIDALVELIKSRQESAPTFAAVRSAPKDLPFGEVLYRSRCGTCHGLDGEGGIGPSLNSQDFLALASDEFLYTTMVKGRENTAMVSWSFLPANQIAAIIAWIRQWQTVPGIPLSSRSITGDVAEGQALFKSLCVGCHGIHGQGAVGTAILNQDFLRAASDEFILRSITRGRSSSAMRSFDQTFQGMDQLTPEELRNVVAFIRSRESVETSAIYSEVTSGTPTKGMDLYNGLCAGCHGVQGEGKHGPSLNNQEFLNAATNGFLQATIAMGRTGTAMRSWAKGAQGYHELNAEEINDIVSYIRTWQREIIAKTQ